MSACLTASFLSFVLSGFDIWRMGAQHQHENHPLWAPVEAFPLMYDKPTNVCTYHTDAQHRLMRPKSMHHCLICLKTQVFTRIPASRMVGSSKEILATLKGPVWRRGPQSQFQSQTIHLQKTARSRSNLTVRRQRTQSPWRPPVS